MELKYHDVWYKKCEKCGHDTAKSVKPKEGNKRCWKCGSNVQRDYSDRSLNKEGQQIKYNESNPTRNRTS